ncbi:hypothetical protein C8R45DRAFT_935058 [Mycena sanguinolenta]|nr:hypothetical protein C8R45DRAFT_935058 [Mycena sanguinolenta]
MWHLLTRVGIRGAVFQGASASGAVQCWEVIRRDLDLGAKVDTELKNTGQLLAIWRHSDSKTACVREGPVCPRWRGCSAPAIVGEPEGRGDSEHGGVNGGDALGLSQGVTVRPSLISGQGFRNNVFTIFTQVAIRRSTRMRCTATTPGTVKSSRILSRALCVSASSICVEDVQCSFFPFTEEEEGEKLLKSRAQNSAL